MDETRAQRPGSNSAGAILASHADLAAAIERVRIYERTALPADQLAGLILAEIDGTAAADRGDGREDYPPACILTGAAGENPDDCTTHSHEAERPPAAGAAANPKIRYLARFTAEAWIRNQATEVDAAGPLEWDCTTLALAHLDYLAAAAARRHESLDDGEGVLDNDDMFKDDPGAPEWVRSWSGPFTIRVRTEPMVTVYWRAKATRAADIWYSTLAELAQDGDLTVPSLRDLISTARIVLPEPPWAGASLAEVLHDSGYEVDGSETLVVKLAVHDEEPGASSASAGCGPIAATATPPADSEGPGHNRDGSQAKGVKTVE